MSCIAVFHVTSKKTKQKEPQKTKTTNKTQTNKKNNHQYDMVWYGMVWYIINAPTDCLMLENCKTTCGCNIIHLTAQIHSQNLNNLSYKRDLGNVRHNCMFKWHSWASWLNTQMSGGDELKKMLCRGICYMMTCLNAICRMKFKYVSFCWTNTDIIPRESYNHMKDIK